MEGITIKEEAVLPMEERNDDEASAVDGLASSFPVENITVKAEPMKVEAVESNQVYLMEEITIKEEAVWPKEERNDDDEASAADGLTSSFPLEDIVVKTEPIKDIVVKTEPIKIEAVESNQDVREELNSMEENSDGTPLDLRDYLDDSVSSFDEAGKDVYPSSQDFMCIQCCIRFPSSSLLKQHRDDGQEMYICKICNESFCTFTVLSQHMFSHLGRNIVLCYQCKMEFCTNEEFLQHMFGHEGKDTLFGCPKCYRSFRTQETLSSHLLTHRKVQRHACQYCDRKFSYRSQLLAHERSHTREKPFKCAECNKAFAEKYYLKIHMETHSRELNFQCPECSKAYSQRSALRAHLLKHRRVMSRAFPEC